MNSLKTIFDHDTWQEIFGSIAKNKTRTVVTVIGVLWGIFIYITLSGSAKGLDNGFNREFQDMAMNSMFVWPLIYKLYFRNPLRISWSHT